MHYSKYLRGIPEPVVEQPSVLDDVFVNMTSQIVVDGTFVYDDSISITENRSFPQEQENDEVVEEADVIDDGDDSQEEPQKEEEFPEKDPESIEIEVPSNTPFTALIQSQEEAEQHALKIPEPKYVDPIVQKLVDLLANTQDIVTKAKMNKLLDIMFEGLENQLHEPDTILDEYEANRIAEYFVELEEKYFNDIAIDRENLPKHFIWNIPRTMYEDMCKAQDDGVIDVLNPMIYMYIALCGYPGEAAARFLKILDDIRFVNVNQFNEYNDKYQEALDAESGETSDNEQEESVAETFARNGYAAEDEDS